MSSYLPPTDDLPIFNPSVFQNDSTEGITLNEGDTRYVKKSGSIMSGALSTPSLLVNSIDVETQLNKISSLETKTTDITFTAASGSNPAKTTIANSLDIDGILSTQSIANLQTAIVANTAKTGITSAQSTAIVANSAKTGITSSQSSAITSNTTKTTDITFAAASGGNPAKTTIANSLAVGGILSTQSIENLQTAILANTTKIATLGSAYVYWQNSVAESFWGSDNRLDRLESTYQRLGTINIGENSTRDGAVDVGAGTYRINVVANIRPRQSGSITITPDRINFIMYLSVNNSETSAPTLVTPSANVYIRQLNNNDQGYGNNLSFEKLYYFSSTTELSIKTLLYSNSVRNYTGTLPESNFSVDCLMVVEKISDSDIESSVSWD